MRSLPLKLPTATIARVDAMADRLHCSRSALVRTLVIDRLEQLEQATTTTARGLA